MDLGWPTPQELVAVAKSTGDPKPVPPPDPLKRSAFQMALTARAIYSLPAPRGRRWLRWQRRQTLDWSKIFSELRASISAVDACVPEQPHDNGPTVGELMWKLVTAWADLQRTEHRTRNQVGWDPLLDRMLLASKAYGARIGALAQGPSLPPEVVFAAVPSAGDLLNVFFRGPGKNPSIVVAASAELYIQWGNYRDAQRSLNAIDTAAGATAGNSADVLAGLSRWSAAEAQIRAHIRLIDEHLAPSGRPTPSGPGTKMAGRTVGEAISELARRYLDWKLANQTAPTTAADYLLVVRTCEFDDLIEELRTGKRRPLTTASQFVDSIDDGLLL
ncbi:hypothetical protein [Nocardia brasiliensis]|uniref:hypothetical protein n=1 Tax=Nocardia brasiliensis TaxID=37326 RepID=UPI00245544DC|nr:hypothetical protein [Nocardia brasiliensis]